MKQDKIHIKRKEFLILKKYTSVILILAMTLTIPSFATESTHNWYFSKTQDHSQPALNAEFSFIDQYSAFYIDECHSDYSSDDKVIYLTFDAGYENGNIEKILDVMKEENVTGAFFILENLINRNPELVTRMASEGHLICNHTAKHPDMTKCRSFEEFKSEVSSLENICKEKLNIQIAPYFRPPEGKFSETTLKYAKDMGYSTIFWSFAYADWDNNNQMSPARALEKLKASVHNGEILLLHPTSATNAEIIKDFICFLKEEGFRFGSLTELTEKKMK